MKPRKLDELQELQVMSSDSKCIQVQTLQTMLLLLEFCSQARDECLFFNQMILYDNVKTVGS